jgi:hypothetical protein
MSDASIIKGLSFTERQDRYGRNAFAQLMPRVEESYTNKSVARATAMKQQLRQELSELGIEPAKDLNGSDGYYFIVSMQGEWQLCVNGDKPLQALKAFGVPFAPNASTVITGSPTPSAAKPAPVRIAG